jgi:hypothetical protein
MATVDGTWVAYFKGVFDPESTVWALSKALHCRAVAIGYEPSTISADRKTGAWGATSFVLYRPGDGDSLRRWVGATNDGGRWTWSSAGEPLPFENLDRYAAPRVRDRLTLDMVDNYCAHLGIRLNDPSYYGLVGYVIENRTYVPLPHSKTLAQVRAELRLDDGRRRSSVRGQSVRGAWEPSDFRQESGTDARVLAERFHQTLLSLSDSAATILTATFGFGDGHGSWVITSRCAVGAPASTRLQSEAPDSQAAGSTQTAAQPDAIDGAADCGDRRRFVEEWRGSAADPEAMARRFRDQVRTLVAAGIAIDSITVQFEDGMGNWEIVATITMAQAEAIGYDHEKRLWLEAQEVFD